jgi:YD repeat-containing protein
VIATVNPLGHSETRTYDALGRLATITDANGGVTSHSYDVFGRLVQRTTPDGGTATAAFANWGNPNTQYVQTAIADGTADGFWTRTYLDGLGRTVRVVNEGGFTTDTVYGPAGS